MVAGLFACRFFRPGDYDRMMEMRVSEGEGSMDIYIELL